MPVFIFLLLLCNLALPALASPPPASSLPASSLPAGDGKQPIAIEADESLVVDQNARTYTALGGTAGTATATRGNLSISAKNLVAYERDNPSTAAAEIYKVTAADSVSITNGTAIAVGDKASYEVDRQVAVLLGTNLKLTSQNDVLTARDSFEYWQAKNLAVARGKAVATRALPDGSSRRVQADELVAELGKNAQGEDEIKNIEARGRTTITIIGADQSTSIASGDKAIYDLTQNKAVLLGNVQLTRGKSQLAGDKAEVDFTTGISRLLTNKQSNQRVRGLIVPEEKSQAEKN